MQRDWIDWSEAFLPRAADWLIDRASDGSALVDMRNVVCVTPGRRAGRVLLALLAERCELDESALMPPRVITPGDLTGELLSIEGALATPAERVLAWTRALREIEPERISALLPAPAEMHDILAWRELAAAIHELHDELAGEDLSFGQVPERAERLELFAEGDRWCDLGRLEERYAAVLAEAGLADPHLARRDALARGDVEPTLEVVLLGVTELSVGQRAIVDAVNERTTALVHAPSEFADRFDDLGCVETEPWSEAGIALRDEQIVVAEGPADQASAAMADLAGLGGAFAADEITIGLCDRELGGPVMRAAEWAGIDVHAAQGTPFAATGPYRLLAAIAAFLEDRRHASFAALARHPDFESWVRERLITEGGDASGGVDLPAVLDRHYSEHLDERPDGARRSAATTSAVLTAAGRAVDDLLASLDGGARSLSAWSDAILAVLGGVYGGLDPASTSKDDRTTIAACLKLKELLSARSKLPAAIQPEVDAADALALLLAEAAGEDLPADVHAHQVEMLEWLELHLDPAPVLTLVGVNDGRLPTAAIGDRFLPDVLRRALGLKHNEQRDARDAYRLEAIRRSRGHLTVIGGRAASDGEPLAPSRLLLTGDDETLLERVRRLFEEPPPHERPLPIGAPRPGAASRFTIPELEPAPSAPVAMAVTEFRAYLECPYRYALARRLRLGSMRDDAREMDALQFGTLAHDVLEAFGKDADARAETDPRRIETILGETLDRLAADRFGERPMPAVRLQLARLAERLEAFAAKQALVRAEGWSIRHAELKFDGDLGLDVPGQDAMPLRGKIDRIDHNEQTGQWRVIDYKTSESGASPLQTHHGRKTLPDDLDELKWCDLQLPLYHYLLRERGLIPADDGGETVELSYFLLPKKADDTAIAPADWQRVHLDAAVDLARDVVRGIRAGKYEINQDYHSPYDDFARICQTYAYHETDDESAPEGDTA